MIAFYNYADSIPPPPIMGMGTVYGLWHDFAVVVPILVVLGVIVHFSRRKLQRGFRKRHG